MDMTTDTIIYTEYEMEIIDYDYFYNTNYTINNLKASINKKDYFVIKCRDKNRKLNDFKFWFLQSNEHYYEFYDSNNQLINLENLIKSR